MTNFKEKKLNELVDKNAPPVRVLAYKLNTNVDTMFAILCEEYDKAVSADKVYCDDDGWKFSTNFAEIILVRNNDWSSPYERYLKFDLSGKENFSFDSSLRTKKSANSYIPENPKNYRSSFDFNTEHSIKYNFFMSQLRLIEDIKDNEKTKISIVFHEDMKSSCILRVCKKRDLSSVCEALLKIKNPNTVVVYDYIYENGDTYILEEHISGSTVEEIMEDKGVLSEKETVRIIIEICKALETLHAINPPVIHNDINPSNIRIREDGMVKLFDFDISRTYKKGNYKNTQLLGTEEYASPEHFGYGQSEPRTDIYCLGATMHEMLTGKVLADGRYITYNGRLRQIIQKCLEIDPENRYPSVSILRKELEKFLSAPKKRGVKIFKLFLIVACIVGAISFINSEWVDMMLNEFFDYPFEDTISSDTDNNIIVSDSDKEEQKSEATSADKNTESETTKIDTVTGNDEKLEESDKQEKPYIISTLASANIENFSFTTMDGVQNLYYIDAKEYVVYKINITTGQKSIYFDPSDLKYQSEEKCYSSFIPTQVFYDDINEKLLLKGHYTVLSVAGRYPQNDKYEFVYDITAGEAKYYFQMENNYAYLWQIQGVLSSDYLLVNGSYSASLYKMNVNSGEYKFLNMICGYTEASSILRYDNEIYSVDNGPFEDTFYQYKFSDDYQEIFTTATNSSDLRDDMAATFISIGLKHDSFYGINGAGEIHKISVKTKIPQILAVNLKSEDIKVEDMGNTNNFDARFFVIDDNTFLFYDNDMQAVRMLAKNEK